MRFLVDRCAGRLLAKWLRKKGHDTLEARQLGPDPGDRALLVRAEAENRIPITIDTDFGELIYLDRVPHAGLVRIPDVSAEKRIELLGQVIEYHWQALEARAVVTIRGDRIRISSPPKG